MSPKDIFFLLRDTFKDWSEDKSARLGAALAYYTMFSIGPLLLIATAVASLVFKDAQAQIVGTISGVVGKEAADVIDETIKNANKGGANIVATIIGIVTLLLGASGVFGQLKDALNTIWEVAPKPGQGILATLRDRFLSFTMVLGTGFLLMVSLVITAAVSALGKFLASALPGSDILWQIVNFIISLGVVALMFALLFKYLPDVKIAWSDVIIGAVVTAVLFVAGQFALAFYLGSGSVGTAFGATGSLVIVLVWIYYSAQIFFFGAEFTQVYTNRYGTRVRPDESAEFVTEEARAQQGIAPQKDEKGETKRDRKEVPKEPRKTPIGGRLASPWFK
jgi:membrane protein